MAKTNTKMLRFCHRVNEPLLGIEQIIDSIFVLKPTWSYLPLPYH